jgi:GTPase SAR1 family protein
MVDRLFAIRAAGQAVIIMFDITSRQTYNHAGLWHKYALGACTQRLEIVVCADHRDAPLLCVVRHRAVTRVHQSAPMVLVGNKLDNHYQRAVQRKHVMFHRRMGMDYHEICALDNYNWAKPLESIFAKFTGYTHTHTH